MTTARCRHAAHIRQVSLREGYPRVGAGGSRSNIVSFPQNGARVFAMRHRKRIARLGRPADQRKALVRGLVTEVLRHGRITTTKASPLWCPSQACRPTRC